MNYRRLFIQNSLVFLTIVTHNRLPIVIENQVALFDAIKETMQYYPFELLAYIFMPDHIHIIIKPENIEKYPKIVHSVKYNFKKALSVGVATPTYDKIFQNRYYEHTIRDENDLYRHLDYIHYNSVKHLKIIPKDWEYSSFREFVESGYYYIDWCNFDDKYSINSMNLE